MVVLEVHNLVYPAKMVSDLIVNGSWDLGAKRQWISDDDAFAICKIPLSHRDVADRLVWLGTKNGVYTVKSGYFWSKNVVDAGRVTSVRSSFSCSNLLRKAIWSDCVSS